MIYSAVGVTAGSLCFVLGVLLGRLSERGRQAVRTGLIDQTPPCPQCGRPMSFSALQITDWSELVRGTRSAIPVALYCGCVDTQPSRTQRNG